MREETRCHHMGYSFRLAARGILYAPSHRQDSTYHGLCYTSLGALAGTTISGFTTKERSDYPLHHERMLLPRSYTSLLCNPSHHVRTLSPLSYTSLVCKVQCTGMEQLSLCVDTATAVPFCSR